MSENLPTAKSLTGFYATNKKNITIALGVVGVAVVGYVAYTFLYANPRQSSAEQALWRVEQWAEMDSMKWVLDGDGQNEGALSIMESYSGTPAAEKATYYAACAKRNAGDFQGALDLFKEVDFNDNTVGIQAIGNVGDMYVELGQLDEAANWLEKAAKKAMASDAKDALAPVYLMKAARVQLERKDNTKAIALLQDVVDNFKRTQEYSEAAKLLAFVQAQSK
jgi:tetratricopeptide (TPR) repeat protein